MASGAARNPGRGDSSRRASWPERPSRAGPRRPAVGLGPGGSRRPWKGAGRDSARWEGPQYTLPKSRARGGAMRAGAGRAGARADIFGPHRPRRPGRGPKPPRGPPARRAGRSLGGRDTGGTAVICAVQGISPGPRPRMARGGGVARPLVASLATGASRRPGGARASGYLGRRRAPGALGSGGRAPDQREWAACCFRDGAVRLAGPTSARAACRGRDMVVPGLGGARWRAEFPKSSR